VRGWGRGRSEALRAAAKRELREPRDDRSGLKRTVHGHHVLEYRAREKEGGYSESGMAVEKEPTNRGFVGSWDLADSAPHGGDA
jgi:hypothetical protein